MKKLLTCVLIVAIVTHTVTAQESKREAKERHKNYWKKVGTDTRDFWKGEHEKKTKKKEEKERKRAEQGEPRKEPRKPPNPFRKKNKQDSGKEG